jgi:hypothetical protein
MTAFNAIGFGSPLDVELIMFTLVGFSPDYIFYYVIAISPGVIRWNYTTRKDFDRIQLSR